MTFGSQGVNSYPLLIGLPFGLLPLGFGAWQIWREFAPRKWSKVAGTIVSSRIDAAPAGSGETTFTPVIVYEYRFNGQSFKSSQRRLRNYVSGQSADAEAISSRYPAGSSVTVFVNPGKPEQSVLEYGVTPLSWIPLAVGLVFILLAFLPLLAK
ncbi:MAG: DUF3592 domain-containing protein [Limisphaerales bacterium]